jgi:glutamate synthase (NADPH/NADH) large chain
MEMLFVGGAPGLDKDALERQLFIIRKLSSHKLRNSDMSQALLFYVCSLSTKLIIYKGMLTSFQVLPFFTDLQAPDYDTHLAMVHSRFATNTFPSWDRAQPLRFMSHNGEINTVKGNSNWMFARQGMMKSPLFGEDIEKLFPIVEPHTSDSGCFDNALEMLYHSGSTLQEVVMMMVPEAWQNHQTMPEDKRAFYEYYSAHSGTMGRASVDLLYDGHYIGATLDRNGLAPKPLLRDKRRSKW